MRNRLEGVTLLAITLLLAPIAMAEEPAMSAEMQEMMAAYVKAGTPGPMHEFLKGMEGKWTITVKSWMGGPEPDVSEGSAEMKMLLGGRWLQETVHGTFGGQAFTGIGTTGYDNMTQKFVGSWTDNMSTTLMTSTGVLSADKKTMTQHGTSTDPLTGKSKTTRMVNHFKSADETVVEFFEPGPDGKEMKTMEIAYLRAK